MKKQMKKVLAVLLSCSTIGTLGVNASSDSGSETEKKKIVFWTYVDTEAQKLQLDLVPDDIELEVVTIPNQQYEQKLRIATSSGAAPDVFMVDGVYVPNYAYNGMLMELDDYVDPEVFDDYVDSSKQKCMYNDKIYALSQQESSCLLFYNKDHFAEAGITDIPTSFEDAWTYDELIDAAIKLTKRDEAGNIIQYGLQPTMGTPDSINEGMTFTLLNWLWNHGFEYVDPDYTTASGYLDSPESIEALQSYADLFTKYQVSPLQAIEQGFQTGKVSMWIHNCSQIGGFEKNFPDLNFGAMPLPKGINHYGTSGGWCYGISSQCKDPESAYKVLNALAGTEGHKIHCEWNKAMPSMKSLIDTLPYITEDPMMVIAGEAIKEARPRKLPAGYAEISPILNEVCNAIAYGEDVEEQVKAAVPKINRIISKYPPVD